LNNFIFFENVRRKAQGDTKARRAHGA